MKKSSYNPGCSRPRGLSAPCTLLLVAAAACGDADLPDDASVADLSQEQRVQLCDELRDDVTGAGAPRRCADGRTLYWSIPSNQFCRDVDLGSMGCDAGTVGELRAHHRTIQSDPCAMVDDPSLDNQAWSFGCAAQLVPMPLVGVTPCVAASLAELALYDGIYEIHPGDRTDDSEWIGVCDETESPFFSSETPYFVLVATDVTSPPSVVLQSCASLAECQAVGEQIRTTGSFSTAATGASRQARFDACADDAGFPLILRSLQPSASEECVTTRQQVDVTRLDDMPGVYLTATTHDNPDSGVDECTFRVNRSPSEPSCTRFQSYGGMLVEP